MSVTITLAGVALFVRVLMAGFFMGSAVLCHRSGDNRTACLWWVAAGAWLP